MRAEAAINHVSGRSELARTYSRHDYSDEIATALKRWQAHVAALVTVQPVAEVVTLADRRRAGCGAANPAKAANPDAERRARLCFNSARLGLAYWRRFWPCDDPGAVTATGMTAACSNPQFRRMPARRIASC
jgi:hypothetical protein